MHHVGTRGLWWRPVFTVFFSFGDTDIKSIGGMGIVTAFVGWHSGLA